jgi:hypothetical protein
MFALKIAKPKLVVGRVGDPPHDRSVYALGNPTNQ